MRRTTCCIVGGGPAGMVLGLLLARSGVSVTVLEKHSDFLRDFRGDTVHPTTMALLDELGLAERFAELPQNRLDTVRLPVGPEGELHTVGDFRRLPIKYNYIAMVPQWDLLDLLANEGRREPNFTLLMDAEVTAPFREHGRVNGVEYRSPDGGTERLLAPITVACDGRNSFARGIPELTPREFPTPMDVQWFRIPKTARDPAGAFGTIRSGSFTALLDRGDYYQVASIIAKGADAAERTRDVENFNRDLRRRLPWLDDGRELVRSWEDVKLLHVSLDRMRKWHVPGLLCIGDAAHAMSPVGGIGINLAVQDAVATARQLAGPLRAGRLRRRHVAAVQHRRKPVTALLQRVQRTVHDNVIEPALRGSIDFRDRTRLPLPLRLAPKVPWLRAIPPYVFAYGAVRERPPRSAVR
ncbi:FAD-dependent oxidoreductase [Actinopolyspora saharensis]|uniref:2-polyprenyl-6-methoxyphenol hydroxylase n=1 Tax=Actinopolyspora saharensis TaxID=995062 RepID=A0A1H1D6H8_9ACTN|nr:FAD-dependent oxidoreductase [Actinopolyspora saharensis]SDQ72042.1 2-polyprenyl-6-methoxyphenol hydroxylase [Actinopolyspora saharensis]